MELAVTELGWWLDSMILKIFLNLTDSVTSDCSDCCPPCCSNEFSTGLHSVSAVAQDGLCCPVSSCVQRNVMITLDSGHSIGEVFLMITEYV